MPASLVVPSRSREQEGDLSSSGGGTAFELVSSLESVL
jgi:hypothetical protein